MTRLRLLLEQEDEWPLAIHASGPSVIIEGDFHLPTLSLLAFSAGGDGGRRSLEHPRNAHTLFPAVSDCRAISICEYTH